MVVDGWWMVQDGRRWFYRLYASWDLLCSLFALHGALHMYRKAPSPIGRPCQTLCLPRSHQHQMLHAQGNPVRVPVRDDAQQFWISLVAQHTFPSPALPDAAHCLRRPHLRIRDAQAPTCIVESVTEQAHRILFSSGHGGGGVARFALAWAVALPCFPIVG
jgi:hypothetical protein